MVALTICGFSDIYNKLSMLIQPTRESSPARPVGDMKRFTKRSDLVTRNISGETIIVPVEGRVGDLDSIYTLNEVGSTIWALLDGQTSIDKIAAVICDRYEVTPEQARQDVVELIDSLQAAGLIQERSDED